MTPGKGLRIGLNARYLLDMLDAVSGEKVYLDLTDELSPGVMRAEDPGFKGVIMPMRI
jgi:DNA polymerase-3 subunit beta